MANRFESWPGNSPESMGTERALAKSRNHIHLLEVFAPVLEDTLIPSHILPDLPFLKDVAGDIRRKERAGERVEAVRLLLGSLREVAESKHHLGWYAEFMEALKENQFEKLSKELQGFAEVKDNTVYENIIQMFYRDLMDVNPVDIAPDLVSKGAISEEDCRRVYSENRTAGRTAAMQELLYMLTRKTENWFVALISALYHNEHRELAEKIVPAITKCQGDIKEASELLEADQKFARSSDPANMLSCSTVKQNELYYSEKGPGNSLLAEPSLPDRRTKDAHINQNTSSAKSALLSKSGPTSTSPGETHRACHAHITASQADNSLSGPPARAGNSLSGPPARAGNSPSGPPAPADNSLSGPPARIGQPAAATGTAGERLYEISPMRFVSVSSYLGNPVVRLREYYMDGEKRKSRGKGVSLTLTEWQKLKTCIQQIDDDIKEKQTK